MDHQLRSTLRESSGLKVLIADQPLVQVIQRAALIAAVVRPISLHVGVVRQLVVLCMYISMYVLVCLTRVMPSGGHRGPFFGCLEFALQGFFS